MNRYHMRRLNSKGLSEADRKLWAAYSQTLTRLMPGRTRLPVPPEAPGTGRRRNRPRPGEAAKGVLVQLADRHRHHPGGAGQGNLEKIHHGQNPRHRPAGPARPYRRAGASRGHPFRRARLCRAGALRRDHHRQWRNPGARAASLAERAQIAADDSRHRPSARRQYRLAAGSAPADPLGMSRRYEEEAASFLKKRSKKFFYAGSGLCRRQRPWPR